MKKPIHLSFCVLLFFSLCAFQIKDFSSGENVNIDKPHPGNLYVAGGNITINAPVSGDLLAAGGNLTVNDSIQEDVLAAGGSLIFNGIIGDDLRCAGGEVALASEVWGDVVMAGGQLTVGKNAIIHGNLIVSGGTIQIDGSVMGEVMLASGDFVLNGTLHQKLEANCGQVTINGVVEGIALLTAESIQIGENAVFEDQVRYWSQDKNLDFGSSLKGGEAVFDENLKPERKGLKIFGFATLIGLFWYLGTVLLMMVILLLLMKPIFLKAARVGLDDLGKTLGLGFLFVLGIPVLILMAFLSLIGLPIGLILLFLYTLIMLFAATISALMIAHYIQYKNQTIWPFWQVILIAFAIFIGLKVLTFIPILGWFTLAVIVLFAFGSILRGFWKSKSSAAETL
ncbi:bactofilin family protein [Pararhodonellum marinum]|uniref:hypothetical protein n=1 Tax=Pararhodonellum marinum TaxID=2755358 RepID=UPI0018902C26|nr:hypothetical protein [Pararhodonellum marinum]